MTKPGRPRRHASNAERQRAYRQRKKAQNGNGTQEIQADTTPEPEIPAPVAVAAPHNGQRMFLLPENWQPSADVLTRLRMSGVPASFDIDDAVFRFRTHYREVGSDIANWELKFLRWVIADARKGSDEATRTRVRDEFREIFKHGND